MFATECITVFDRTKEQIEADLRHLGPDVVVFASRETEDGPELILEGDSFQIQDLIYLWGGGEGEVDDGFRPEVQ